MSRRKKIAVYLRVSTLDKQKKGLDSQRHALKRYCNNHGFDNVIWYKDRLSGKDLNRPAFKKLQRDIFNGRIGTVIVWKLDRLSRSLKDGINVLTGWLDKDIRIVSTQEQLDFSGATGQLIASVLFAVAAMQRESLREATKRGIAAARARGAVLGKRPKLFTRDIIPLFKQGKTLADISRELDKTRQAIYDCFRREGVDMALYRN